MGSRRLKEFYEDDLRAKINTAYDDFKKRNWHKIYVTGGVVLVSVVGGLATVGAGGVLVLALARLLLR